MAEKQYDNTNKGAIFVNDKKDNEKHPDYKGKLNAEGKEFFVSAWVNTSKAGAKYLSFQLKSVAEWEAKKGGKKPAAKEDDVPF